MQLFQPANIAHQAGDLSRAVTRITGGKYAGFQAEAGIYSSPEVAMPIDTVGVSFGFVPGQNLLETGYAALKGLPQFSGSGDC